MRFEPSSSLVKEGPAPLPFAHAKRANGRGDGSEGAPFDAAAESYDREFTETSLGRALRQRVWRRLEARFAPGAQVLELNCGTGEDAAWLARRGVSVLATDQSEAMLAMARRKTIGLPVETACLDLSGPEVESDAIGLFDGAFSDFGGLNCVLDLEPLARFLADRLRPNAPLVLVVMGPGCLWEVAWHLAHLKPGTAFRRWRRGGSAARPGDRTFKVVYPWPGKLARSFAPEFRPVRLEGLGVALPPSLLAGALERHRRVFKLLGAIEAGIAGVWPFTYLGDHYILELERCG